MKQKLWGILFGLAIVGCSGEEAPTADDVAGCYVLDWGPDSSSQPHLFPDSIELTLAPYRPDCCYGLDTLMVQLDARVARPVSEAPDTAWLWKSIFAGFMHWYVVGDSIHLALHHDCAECIGFDAEARDGRLRGVGFWLTDYQEPRTFALTGIEVTCPMSTTSG